MKMMKPMKAYKDGGKVAPFTGKDTKAEEVAEAKAVRSGKVSAREYVARERAEEAKEGEKFNARATAKKGKDLASGKLSAEKYGAMAKMANGGKVAPVGSMGKRGKPMPQGFMDGGMVGNEQRFAVMQDPLSARGSNMGRGMAMKMADGGCVGYSGGLSGKNMKKGGK